MTQRYANIGLGLLLWVLSAWVIWQTTGLRDPRTGDLPLVLSAFWIFSGAILIVLNVVPKTGRPMERTRPFGQVPWRRWAAVAACLALFGVGAVTIGFYESAFLFLYAVGSIMASGRQNRGQTVWTMLVFALIATSGLYLGFSVLLGIPFPDGILI